jgi:pantoate--beta-alanine ligase
MGLFTHHKQFATLRKSGKTSTLGMVPTMGALHEGHLSLIEKALGENDQILVSIFINPTQFNNPEDLSNYPSNVQEDVAKIQAIAPDILIYAPQAQDVYGSSITSKNYDFGLLHQVMEGATRKGHFEGVATVVEQLFTLFRPNTAYFGEKDFQQLQVIKQLVVQKNLGVHIVSCPIVRAKDGLALSSRNQLLTPEARKCANELYAALLEAQKVFTSLSVQQTVEHILKRFDKHPIIQLDYFEIREETTLESYAVNQHQHPRAFIAAQLGKIRLIDNLSLEKAIPLQHAN